MALNRTLYSGTGTNIVSQGRMSQRWLLDTTTGKINTSTDEFGRALDATVGRGLLLTDTGAGVVFVNGKFDVTLQPGNSITNFVNVSASVAKFNVTVPHCIVPTQLKQTGVTFQTWSWATPGPPSVFVDNPPVSAVGSVGALAAIAGPYCGTDGTQTTLGGVPVTVTSGLTTQAVSGLTATLTFAAAASVNATALVAGRGYTITTLGTTNFTLCGASSNTIGTSFVATVVGAGTGTCITQQGTGVALDTTAPNTLALLSPYGDNATTTTWTLQLPPNCGGGVGVVCNSVAALATTAVLSPRPSWLSVDLEFTTSSVVA